MKNSMLMIVVGSKPFGGWRSHQSNRFDDKKALWKECFFNKTVSLFVGYFPTQNLLSDAAYRTTWMWKSCALNGRKVFSRLFFRPKTVRFAALFTWIRTNGETSLFPSEVHLFSIRCEGTKISGIFTNWCQLKTRCTHEDFAAKRKNRLHH